MERERRGAGAALADVEDLRGELRPALVWVSDTGVLELRDGVDDGRLGREDAALRYSEEAARDMCALRHVVALDGDCEERCAAAS